MSTRTMVITLEVREVPGGRDPATMRRDVANAIASHVVPRLPILSWTAEEQGAGVFAQVEHFDPPRRPPHWEAWEDIRITEELLAASDRTPNPDLQRIMDQRGQMMKIKLDDKLPRVIRRRAEILSKSLHDLAGECLG